MIEGGRNATNAAARPAADRRGRNHNLAALTGCLCAALALPGAATPLLAQQATQAGTAISREFLAGLPDSFFGAKASRLGASTVTYFPRRLGSGPFVMVGAGPSDRTTTYERLRSSARTAFNNSRLLEMMREGSFDVPKWPGALTFFGEYRADAGLKQVWSADTGSDFIAVTVTYFDEKDSARVETAIADRIFGGAVVTAAKPAE